MRNYGHSINNLFYEVPTRPSVCANQHVNAHLLQMPNTVFKLLKEVNNLRIYVFVVSLPKLTHRHHVVCAVSHIWSVLVPCKYFLTQLAQFVSLYVLTPCHESCISGTQMVAPNVEVYLTTHSKQGVCIWGKLTYKLVAFVDK